MIVIYGLTGEALDRIKDSLPNIIRTCERESLSLFTVELNGNTILKFYNENSSVNLDLAGRIATMENGEFDRITLF